MSYMKSMSCTALRLDYSHLSERTAAQSFHHVLYLFVMACVVVCKYQLHFFWWRIELWRECCTRTPDFIFSICSISNMLSVLTVQYL